MFSDSIGVSIHQLVETQALKTPDAVAIVFKEQQLTYCELNQKANQLAHYLQTLGVKPDVLVGVCVERSLEMFVALLGVLKAGGAYIPLDPNYPPERLAFILEDAQVPILLTQQHLHQTMPQHNAQNLFIDSGWETIAHHLSTNPQSQVQRDNLAYVIYTSGSTGKPKGVQIVHGAAVNLLQSMQKEPGITASDTLLAITTVSFDLSVPDLYLPLITGARIRLIEREIAADANRLSQILSDPDVTFVQATPATWRLVLVAGWKGNPNLKVLCGGEALTRALANQLLDKVSSLWHMYGPTETTVWSMVHQVDCSDRPVPLGHAIAETQIYLVKEGSRRKSDPIELVEVGEAGEIYIGGAGVARGYLGRPELTHEKFIADPFSSNSEARLYKTGDSARLLADGNIEMIGRMDNQVKIRGYRIELGDIETTLSQHPHVRESAVIAVEDSPGNRRLVAYVVLNSLSPELRPAQIRSWLKEKLPDYMVPGIVFFMDTLPLTPNRKVDRRALPITTLNLQEEIIPARTLLEQQIIQLWSGILGVEVGIDHHFFESGGDSLRAAMLLSRAKEMFQVELTLECLFKAPTVAGFAEIIKALRAGVDTGFKTSPAELMSDANLDPSIRPIAPVTLIKSEFQYIFLTGATGFIGAFLLHELLLKYPQITVYCLVRANDLETASSRLRKALENYDIWHPSFGSRIIPILGDLSRPLFGLSEQQFRELADRIDVIYHSGAYVNLVYPYTALRNANVIGTQEVLRLATQTRTLPVHYISTIDVFHAPEYQEMELILESNQLEHCDGYSEGYAQSKWVAEKLVIAARDRGLPVCIYRLGMITGHSQTGGFQLDNLICRMIKGFIQLGYASDLDLKMSLAPVDYIAQAIAHLSHQSDLLGQTFHLVSPHQLTLEQLIGAIATLGYSINVLPHLDWQAKLLTMPSDNALVPAISMFTQSCTHPKAPVEAATFVSQAFDTQNTQAGLAGTNITCPAITSEVLQIYLSYFVRHKFLPRPPRSALQPTERAWVEIDLEALIHNVQQIKKLLSPTTKLMAIVKADAYGHGAVTVARTVLEHGATCLGVATISEGIELRRSEIKAPIILLGSANTPSQVRTIADWRLQPTLCSLKQALMFSTTLATSGYSGSLPVHLCIDTGMSRLGISWQNSHQLVQLVEHLPNLQIASIYSHLATADDPDTSTMYLQNSRFQEAIDRITAKGFTLPQIHLANSAATLQDSALHYDMVRVGLLLYGLEPSSHLEGMIDLKPVLQVKAKVTMVKTIPPGTGVSYGHQFIATQETRLAVVGIGYADGVSRRLSNQMTVLIRGQRISQVGMITMDQLMLDVTSLPDLQEGEIVTLIGQDGTEHLSIEEWSRIFGTISWEILCGFKQRLPRSTKSYEPIENNMSVLVS
ncbi:MAG: alanine racemase [Timaviella obliquedivisa GSE-PSE-MK23-08B]|jgi:alanine racemase|nr:alanine racemase [Timaviella obliquedivisa GSE-PSE-MK23-08B]